MLIYCTLNYSNKSNVQIFYLSPTSNSDLKLWFSQINYYFKISWFKIFSYCLEYFSSRSIHSYYFSSTMAYLSERERIPFLMMRGWGDHQRSYNEVRQIFNKTFCDENAAVSRFTVRTVRRFNKTISVKNRQISGQSILAWRKTTRCCTIICQKSPPQHNKSAIWHVAWLCREFWKKKVSFV